MTQIVTCDAVTVSTDGKSYDCVGIHVMTYTSAIPQPLDYSEASNYMELGFFTMFKALAVVLVLRTIYRNIPRR